MNIKLARPLTGNYRISFRFGEAPGWYVKQFGYPHNGVDFACNIGQSVKAVDDGRIVSRDDIADGNGKGIIVLHAWGTSLYWHLSECVDKLGAIVKRGQEIGKSGATGFVTGPHLHFGIKIIGVNNAAMHGWADPLLYIEEANGNQQEPPEQKKYYIVRPGDTLYKIALKMYGQGYLWPKIYNANKKQIKDPNKIYTLQKLYIK